MIDALLLAALLAAAPAQPDPAAPAGEAEVHDDAWLEAALAAWPEAAALHAVPRAPPAPGAVAWLRRAAALAVDALPSARALRQPLPARPNSSQKTLTT